MALVFKMINSDIVQSAFSVRISFYGTGPQRVKMDDLTAHQK